MKLYLGIDGGATKTLAAIVNEKLDILGIGIAGPSNYHTVGLEKTIENIKSSIINASEMAKVKPIFDTACIALAAINSKLDYIRLFKKLAELNYYVKLKLVHDGEAAINSIVENKGIVVILGTGSLVATYNNRWNYIRTGNWGHIIGDEGSAYRIAVKTLNYVMKIYDGRLKYSPIIDEITKILKIEDCSEIATIIYTDLKNEDIARLAPLAIQFATKDNFLYKIIKEEAEEIAMAIKAVYLKTKYSNVYLTGGLTKSKKAKFYIDLIKEEIKKIIPSCKVKVVKVHPVLGSIVIALKENGIQITKTERVKLAKELDLLLKSLKY